MAAPVRTGPRSDGDARERILGVARELFAANGYAGTTIRAVAAAAGVDVALVPYYFGRKEQLFAASMAIPIRPDELLAAAFEAGIDQAGERVVRAFLGLWEDPASGPALLALLRSAATHEQSRRALSEFVSDGIVRHYAINIGGPDGARRGMLAAGQLIGVAMARHVIRVEPMVSWTFEELVADLAPTIQRYFTGPLPAR